MGQGKLNNVNGLLVDLDGVLYIGERLIDGAAETIRLLKSRRIPLRFTTNTTTLSGQSLHEKLVRLGLPIERGEIFGVLQAAVEFLRRRGRPACKLLLTDDPSQDFSEFPTSDENPDFIVVGDIGKRWDYELMNEIFRLMIGGAELVALHKGKYWETEAGLQVDMGAFVAGLEYVTGKSATVIGKPSETFFRLAAESLGLPVDQVVMVGDDIDSDIGGAQKAGIRGILVRTGKYRQELAARSDVKPDFVIDSISDLIGVL